MRSITLIAAALGGTCWTVPASGQVSDPASVEAELAAMRTQIAGMATRIEALESELAATNSEAAGDNNAEPVLDIAWKGAPEISGEGGWSFKPRGRIQVDAGLVRAPESASYSDGFGSELRRARLGVEGDIPGGFGYKLEVDFAGDVVAVTDALLTYESGGFLLTAGQHNNFQSLDELTSDLHTPFLERAAFTDAFGFERRVGISAQYAGKDGSGGPVLRQLRRSG